MSLFIPTSLMRSASRPFLSRRIAASISVWRTYPIIDLYCMFCGLGTGGTSPAAGFIKGIAGGNKFTATFVIDDIQYHFSGSFDPAVQEFQSNEATLEYSSASQLTTKRDFDGKVGTQDVTITIANGSTIKGPLNLPFNPAFRISGSRTWAQN
ncbi:unnamed protein product [Clonostachys chloroleuca]|uniref:Uncharacterized protein n=1 Tax=Clonostachys chloroleuca TaxID=1926264 RepID=A0AA35QFC5_9HYPO|nr:unnamed protein product [Clonostachys chloroleuca]